MNESFKRLIALIGEEKFATFSHKKVAIFGLGGVGGYCLNALARSGIGEFILVDHDVINESNINRQIIANVHTLGRKKVDVAEEMILSINPEAKISKFDCFYSKEQNSLFPFKDVDYVVDAIDSVGAKLDLIEASKEAGTKIISCMGMGNKLDPTRIEVADIYQTSVCPLAKVIRQGCKKRGIPSLKVVYSKESPIKPTLHGESRIIGSTAFVPPSAGLVMASEIIRDFLAE